MGKTIARLSSWYADSTASANRAGRDIVRPAGEDLFR